MSELKGSTKLFALPDVLLLLSRNAATGTLKVSRESGEGAIHFWEGRVNHASSELTRDWLGDKLVSAGLITRSQLLTSLDEQKRSGARLGDILVESKLAEPAAIEKYLQEQIQDTVFDLIQWDTGEFEFSTSDVSTSGKVPILAPVEELLMEAGRRLEEWEVIRRKIPSMKAVLKVSPILPDDRVEVHIKKSEWPLLSGADGSKTLSEIAASCDLSDFEAARISYGMVTAGLLDVVDPGGQPAPPPAGEPEARKVQKAGDVRSEVQEIATEGVVESERSPESRPAVRVENGVSKETLQRLIAGVRKL